MEYYTGFVFEFRASAGAPPIGGGGRYDNLLTALGSPKPTPAVGLAIYGERLLAARNAQGASAS
jgi:ATP phosphoribosyltransferase regulatory subunit